MASRRKSEELLDNELDMISELPDPLICQILYHLSTRDAVRTSVLSTRWRTLWLWVPSLDLSFRDFQDLDALVNFGDSFFDRVSCIDKVVVVVDINHGGVVDPYYVTLWIDAAVKHKIQHLTVQSGPYRLTFNPNYALYHQMPLSLYICETLVSLKLLNVLLPDSEFISLPCLKTLHLKVLWNPNATTLERLVTSCPVLEELDIREHLSDDVQVLRVISRSLKKLSIKAIRTKDIFLIDTPRLGFLSIESCLLESYTITNMDTDVKLVIHLGYGFGAFDGTTSLLSNRNRFCSFLSGVSKVRDLTIPGDCRTGYSCLKWLPTILESFPNLKSFTLAEWYHAEWFHGIEFYRELQLEDMDEINFSYVPQCLLSSLEFVDFNVPLSSIVGEMNLVRYILENSAILKKLTLRLTDCSAKKYDLVKKIIKIPRGSTKCEVVVFDWEKSRKHSEVLF